MNRKFENFTDLLIEISNEVLINRPCFIIPFISRLLESNLDRRTLFQMQMEFFDMEKEKIEQKKQESSSSLTQTTLLSKFVARDSYLAHLASMTLNNSISTGKEKSKIDQIKEKLKEKTEKIVYEQVMNSINVLIDLEKSQGKTSNVFGLLKESVGRRSPHTGSGIEESACLKPSIFRKLEQSSPKKYDEWSNKVKKLKAYKNLCEEVGIPKIADKIIAFSKLEQSASTGKKHNNVSRLAKHFTAMNTTSKLPTNIPSSSPLKKEVSPREANSSTNISPEFEFNKRLINSSAECLLDSSKVKLDNIVNENHLLLKGVTPMSSCSSLSSIDDIFKNTIDEFEQLPRKKSSTKNILRESPENINLLASDKPPLVRRRHARCNSESKVQRPDWKSYRLRGLTTSESAQEVKPLSDVEQSPSETENHVLKSSPGEFKWVEGLESSLKEIKSWSRDYYRTTWIVNSNTSLGLLDDSAVPLEPTNVPLLGSQKSDGPEASLHEASMQQHIKEKPTTIDKPEKPLCDLLTSLPGLTSARDDLHNEGIPSNTKCCVPNEDGVLETEV